MGRRTIALLSFWPIAAYALFAYDFARNSDEQNVGHIVIRDTPDYLLDNVYLNVDEIASAPMALRTMGMATNNRPVRLVAVIHLDQCQMWMAMTMADPSIMKTLVGVVIVVEDVGDIVQSIAVDVHVAVFVADDVDVVLYHCHQDRTCGVPIHQMNMNPLTLVNTYRLQLLS